MMDACQRGIAAKRFSGSENRRFTLIELLTVVVILLILVAMLLPALEQARYKAVQVVDSARFKNLYAALNLYAENNDRVYPNHGAAHWIKLGAYTDLRSNFGKFVGGGSFNDLVNDPFAPDDAVDYYNQSTAANVYYSTTIWAGSADAWSPKRMGRDWPGNTGYKVLGGDYNQDWGRLGGHPGRNGVTQNPYVYNTAAWFGAVWNDPSVAVNSIGPIVVDHAYFYTDGHVRLFSNVSAGDPNFVTLPSIGESSYGHFIPIVD